jgi:hypothetical protein
VEEGEQVSDASNGKTEEYRNRILTLGHTGLLKMWDNIQAGTELAGWPRGKALEYLLLRAFQLEGAEVSWPYGVGLRQMHSQLEQIDGAIYFDGVSCLVECKDQHKKKNLKAVPIIKLKAQLMRRPRSTIGAVFSIGGFTPEATTLVQMLSPTDVLLWRGAEIDLALRRQRLCDGMRRKLRYAVEYGFPDLDLTEEGFQ